MGKRVLATCNSKGGIVDKREFELRLQEYVTRFLQVYSDYMRANSDFLQASMAQLLHVALMSLQDMVEDTGVREPGWARVSGMVPWPVDFDEEMLPQFFTVRPRDLRDRKTIAKAVLRHFPGFPERPG